MGGWEEWGEEKVKREIVGLRASEGPDTQKHTVPS